MNILHTNKIPGRVLAVLLAAVLLLALLPAMTLTAHAATGDYNSGDVAVIKGPSPENQRLWVLSRTEWLVIMGSDAATQYGASWYLRKPPGNYNDSTYYG